MRNRKERFRKDRLTVKTNVLLQVLPKEARSLLFPWVFGKFLRGMTAEKEFKIRLILLNLSLQLSLDLMVENTKTIIVLMRDIFNSHMKGLTDEKP